MAADFYHPATSHGFNAPLELSNGGDPYRNDAVKVRYARKAVGQPYKREHHVTVFHKEDQTLNFDPTVDYIVGGVLQRPDILEAFDKVRTLATQPGARWKADDAFDKSSGMVRRTEKLVINGVVEFEHIVLSIHPHQHLIDAGRGAVMAEVKKLKAVKRPTADTKTALAYLMEVLHRPITLPGFNSNGVTDEA